MNRAEMSRMLTLFPSAIRVVLPALAALVTLSGCARPAPPEGPAPAALAKADPSIVALQPTAKGVRVIARVDQPDLAGDSIRTAARAVRQLARAVQNNAADLPPTATVLTFDLYGVDVDKFGKRTPGRIFEADFDVGDLHAIDPKQKGPAAVLNKAIDLRIDKAGIDAINAWCMRYPHVGGDYCEMAGD
jgi:hypothetical protein